MVSLRPLLRFQRHFCLALAGLLAVTAVQGQTVSLFKDINPSPEAGDSRPSDITEAGGITYFTASEFLTGEELWRTDGTAAGTVLVKDIFPGAGDSSPNELTAFNGRLFFRAFDPVNGTELWESDGTPAGTVLVKDIFPGAAESLPFQLTVLNLLSPA